MAPTTTKSGNGNGSPVLVTSTTSGVTVIDPSTPLRRLNYFDGKLLRANDFEVEQRYMRGLVALSNQGLGPGIVYGYDTAMGRGDTIQIGPGLAMDPAGHVLLLQSTVTESIQALIEASRTSPARPPDASGKSGGDAFSDCVEVAAPPPTAVLPVSDIYVIAICAAEALCGQADVYGKLCEDACVTSTDRPYRLDGVVLRAIPLQLVTPFPTSKAVNIASDIYLRSKVAHSWFADETRRHPDAISRAGLLSAIWCAGAGYDAGCCEVPLAVVARAGSTTLFLDTWIVRRERMDAPARRYWQWRMRMRPWDVFLAQILQFQCQLADVLSTVVVPGGRDGDPCAPQHKALRDAVQFVEQVRSGLDQYRRAPAAGAAAQPAPLQLSLASVSDLRTRLQHVLDTSSTPDQPTDRILIQRGLLELPPAGYLPVLTGTSVTVNDQVRALLGDGLDLRFCTTTADYIAHAVEEAQHMDRISLIEGLDDPQAKPHVDILVPDGQATTTTAARPSLFTASARWSTKQTGAFSYRGAAREEALETGGAALDAAAAGLSQNAVSKLTTLAKKFAPAKSAAKPIEIDPNLEESAFINQPKATSARLSSLLEDAQTVARRYIVNPSAAPRKETAAERRAVATYGTVDGLWLTAQTGKAIRTLSVNQQTPLSLRAILGRHPATPEAIEIAFHGQLTVSSVATAGGTRVIKGSVSGMYAIGELKEDADHQRTTEYLLTERGSWPATITCSGDDSDGSIVMDFTGELAVGSHVRLSKTFAVDASQITYEVALVPAGDAAGAPTPIGRLYLNANADVSKPDHPAHTSAETALDIVQTTLIVSEPMWKQTAEAALFPPPPSQAPDLAIQAVRDWVMFTRRREKRCLFDAAPVPTPPDRRYRILTILARDEEDARKKRVQILGALKNEAAFAKLVLPILRKEPSGLVVPFRGGTAIARTDPAAIESDWKTLLHPGRTIVLAAAGASGETDQALQIDRLHAIEQAVRADSIEAPSAPDLAILPYPEAARPPDADGLMLFLTLTVAESQQVFAANVDIFQLVMRAARNPEAPMSLAELLGGQRVVDLGNETFTVDGAGAVTVDDAAVVKSYQTKLPQRVVGAAALLLESGTSAAQRAERVAAATRVVQDLTAGARPPEVLTYAGDWPADTPSVLVVEHFSPPSPE